MISVFIAHHPSDALAAADLAGCLNASGVDSRLGQTADEAWELRDAAKDIIIIWSLNSLSSPFLYEIAATVADSRLLHIGLGDVAVKDIAYAVRPDRLIPVADHRRIVKMLAVRKRLRETASEGVSYALRKHIAPLAIKKTTPEEEKAAAREAAQRETAIRAQQAALGSEAGKLVHKIPEIMTVDVEEVIEVRLGRAEAQDLTIGLMGAGQTVQEDLLIVETMTVELRSLRGAFIIVRHSRPTQLVNRKRFKCDGYDDFGKWIWQVTPKKRGMQEMRVTVSAALLDSRGVPASTSLPPRTFTVRVRVNYGQLSGRMLKLGATGLFGALCAGIVGAFTQDIWWPTIKGWMQALGVLT